MDVNKIYHGKMEDVLKDFPNNFCDSVVTDPPYGISFMGKRWDYNVPTVEQWEEAFRVLKPGGYMLCACGTRTQHRMVVNIEDVGFEIRDVITWHYGSGFPKSLDISKAIDKQAGVEREVIGQRQDILTKQAKDLRTGKRKIVESLNNGAPERNNGFITISADVTAPFTESAKQWEGYGTALKPATEFWTLCRKPISEKTVADNVLKYSTGGLNIDGCRIETEDKLVSGGKLRINTGDERKGAALGMFQDGTENLFKQNTLGRFPANVILDEFMGKELDRQSGVTKSNAMGGNGQYSGGVFGGGKTDMNAFEDIGGASRFFYCPKPDNFERNKGLKNFDAKRIEGRDEGQDERNVPYKNRPNPRQNHHTTVKPLDLMRYLVRLVTPKKGICLDPFCGSGTTLAAAKMELMNYVGIDIDESYIALAEARVKLWNPDLYKPQELF